MKRILFVLVCAGVCMGQMCGAPVSGPFNKMEPNDQLRSACSGLVMSDDFIRQFLQLIEARKEQGETRLQALQRFNQVCIDTPGPNCDGCFAAMIGQVYDNP